VQTAGVTDVVCLGILVADVVAGRLEELPARGSLGLVDGIALHGGGCALNSASALSRLGLRSSVAGKVGADALGDHLLRLLDERGVDRSGVLRDELAATSASVVLVAADGERTFLHAPGANARLTLDELDLDRLYDARCLHVAGTGLLEQLDGEPLAEVLAGARRRGLTTSVDTAWDARGRLARVAACLRHADLACPSLAEARAISGEHEAAAVAAWFRARGPEWVALTMGADGCYASGPGLDGHVPAHPVDAVDSTGAGDAFAAGLVYGRLAGWAFERAVRFASAAGALATTSAGASSGAAGADETSALAFG
jgi:sugar/nucleoside kinase (ribokinase family)